jgi:hypothetical protein
MSPKRIRGRRRILNVGPLNVRFKAVDEDAALPVIADLSTGQPATRLDDIAEAEDLRVTGALVESPSRR